MLFGSCGITTDCKRKKTTVWVVTIFSSRKWKLLLNEPWQKVLRLNGAFFTTTLLMSWNGNVLNKTIRQTPDNQPDLTHCVMSALTVCFSEVIHSFINFRPERDNVVVGRSVPWIILPSHMTLMSFVVWTNCTSVRFDWIFPLWIWPHFCVWWKINQWINLME